ncbi:calcium-translocating P-type ATPase, PMCA-type [Clostridia bacterium]|nr:calcium-translocating P-type ATPase, PMCA-type [Clostridia bacterium]
MSEYTATVQELAERYGGVSAEEGLTSAQADLNLEKWGENKLEGKKRKSLLVKFLAQLKDYMVIILIAAAVVSFIIALAEGSGDFVDSVIIIAIVIVNGALGVRQESQAEKALDALKDLSAPSAKVMRDGVVITIPSLEVVPGDIVILEAGDMIPADGRLIDSASLKCDESALTGESEPAEKDYSLSVPDNAPLGDRVNMVFSGCPVTYGRGAALITATGMRTEMGRIAGLLNNNITEATPLQQKLNQMGKYLGFIAIGICAVIFVIGLIQGSPAPEMFMTAVSLAVAAIPEGLTMVVTVVLAMGVQRMVKKNAIIRRLPAVETLGGASVICSDKTGTLTQNRMTVKYIWPAGKNVSEMDGELSPVPLHVIRLGALCNDGRVTETPDGEKYIGDPTETAIVSAALKNGLRKDEMDGEFPRVAELPFDSSRKLMTTVHNINGKLLSVTKGGFDVLLPLCVNGDRSRAAEVNLAMGKNALRVLAIACRELESLPEEITSETLENELTFIGLIAMMDPPREESRDAVEKAHGAGIRTVMITGDHVITAGAIAKQLGILREGQTAISGRELEALSDGELVDNVGRFSVYARVSPEDKIRIVKAWQARGEVVAMTGDGVNDAPALKAADIGCAMGITGTDVAKGAADMVLTDDNFSTIIEAVRSGRGIYDNIRKTIQFLLSSNLGEVFVVFFAILLGWGSPLLAIHLLLVNVITDAFPALALGVEPADQNIMDRKPVPRGQGVFAGGLGVAIGLQGAMIGILTLAAYYIGSFLAVSPLFPGSHAIGMTMAFLVLSVSQLTQAVNCRSAGSIFKIGFLSSKAMLQAIAGSLALIVAICFIPPLKATFKLVSLSTAHWLIAAALALAPLVIVELAKLMIGAFRKNR